MSADSCQLLRLALDSLPYVIGVVDGDHRILFYNAAGMRLLGESDPSRVLGRRCFELIGNSTPCADCPVEAALASEEPVRLTRFEPVLGRHFHCEAIPVIDADGRTLVVEVLREIPRAGSMGEDCHQPGDCLECTRPCRMREQLAQMEGRFRTLVESMPLSVMQFDAQGVVRFVNRWHLTRFAGGLPASHFLGRRIDELEGIRSAGVGGKILQVLSGQAVELLDVRVPRFASGRSGYQSMWAVPFVRGGRTEGGILIRQDVSARVRIQQEFLQSEERLALALDAVEDGLWDWNLVTNEAYFSPRYYTMLGYQPGEFPATYDTWKRLLHPEDLAPTQHRIETAIAAGQGFRVEFRCRTKDGQWKWIEGRGRVVEFDDGRPVRAVGTHTDMTERMQARRALLEARDAAEAANRVKSEFLANMSHEIRTPLNGMMGMLQLLLMTDLSDEQAEYVRTGMESCQRLTQLLSDILDLSRMEAGGFSLHRAPFDLHQAVDDVCRLFAFSARMKGITLHWHVDSAVPRHVEGDGVRLQQILSNLVGNAVKFTPHGEVRVEVRRLPVPLGDAERVYFSVQDTGVGIAPEVLPRLFAPFSQADGSMTRRFQGAGLGLAIVKELIRRMQGVLSVESEPGEGTTVHFVLPLRPVERAVDVDAVPPLPCCASGRVLVVEDDPINRMAATQLLSRLGYEVLTAATGADGVAVEAAESVDVVLLDIQLPDIDGVEVVRRIRARHADGGPRVVALTAFAMPGDSERFVTAGMDAYLAKPVDFQTLATTLARVLGRE
ncbi:histidine kinase [Thermodesulfomicrobium sp. WS]|uniref:ATP-binding protein n=1 Tax=Thermodesulfomicrobium sp. WS TaxID=3004129 RepID=UPI002492D6D8|nr:ATP-binding protein [Thermodesulfomicrobium sp. WS]BDV02044.1 histidine kinase [Thermodesulfomicrobium sp. WS]